MKRPRKVDSLIVGGGLVGLKLLKRLEEAGEKVFLAEKTSELGGTSTHLDLENETIKMSTLMWKKSEGAEMETLTLGKKGLTPFLGFGKNMSKALEVAENFTRADSTPIRKISFKLEDLTAFKTLTQVTKILSQEGRNFCELNGKDQIEFNKLYWTAPMAELLKVFDKDHHQELRQKTSKAKSFDGMTIQFDGDMDIFKDHQDSKFILFGEEETPWMGALTDNSTLTFTTFYPYTLSQDHDFIRRHLKSLKRQVRKIFPDLYSEDQISLFSSDRLTLHTNALSMLNLTSKIQKEIAPVVFLGSHKEHYPMPSESKLKFVDPLSPSNTDTALQESHNLP